MPIPFTCPNCGKHTEVAEQYAGRSGPCAGCGQTVTIPALAGDSHPPLAPRASNTLTVVLIVVGVLVGLLFCGGLLAGLLLPAVMATREAARKTTCAHNLKVIGTALIAYEQQYGRLPPAYVTDSNGRPLYSWRVLLLPFLEQESLYRRFQLDEPWDSPHNRALAEQMPAVYRCPSRRSADQRSTNYMVIVGERTVFPGPKGIRLADIRDGLSRTLTVVETEGPGICWTSPIDLSLNSLTYPGVPHAGQGIGGPATHTAGLLFGDGAVSRSRFDVDTAILRQAAIRDDGLPQTAHEIFAN